MTSFRLFSYYPTALRHWADAGHMPGIQTVDAAPLLLSLIHILPNRLLLAANSGRRTGYEMARQAQFNLTNAPVRFDFPPDFQKKRLKPL